MAYYDSSAMDAMSRALENRGYDVKFSGSEELEVSYRGLTLIVGLWDGRTETWAVLDEDYSPIADGVTFDNALKTVERELG